MSDVRLLPGPFLKAREANLSYRGASTPAGCFIISVSTRARPRQPSRSVDGKKPDCELRGHHFVGHFLSACALMYSSTADSTRTNRCRY